ncbi:MAG: hypothetical protein WCK98_07060 [bacterium]
MTETKTLKQKTKLFWSVLAAIVSLILMILANFLPVIYFTAVGFPQNSDGIENNPIFTLSGVLGYTSLAVFVVAVITSVVLYSKKNPEQKV